MAHYPDWLSLRDLDTRLGLPKGSAFRAFKRLATTLHEGRDFVVLDHEQERQAIVELKNERRAYQSSVNLILLHPDAAQQIAALLRPDTGSIGN